MGRLQPNSPLASPLALGPSDTLKVLLTATDGNKPAQPHQAFLTLHEPETGLEESFPLTVKDSGKGKLELVCFLTKKHYMA